MDQVPPARRRHLGELLRRSRLTCPPRWRPTSRCGWPATRRMRTTWPRRPAGSGQRGGIPATRVFTRIWLALFGEWSWDDLPVMPPELIYLPSWFPLNVYDWACWARQTIVPLTIVGSLRPVRALPVRPGRARVTGRPPGAGPASGSAAGRTGGRFGGLDRALHVYERHGLRTRPLRAVHTAALRRCAEWIIARQEADGCWGGIQPPWVYSLIALHLLGYDLDHPVLRRGPGRPGLRSRSGPIRPRGRSAGSRRASRRSGTPCWP